MKWLALIVLVLLVAGCTGSDFEYQEEEEKIHEVERTQPGIEEHIDEEEDTPFDTFGVLLLLIIVFPLFVMLKEVFRL